MSVLEFVCGFEERANVQNAFLPESLTLVYVKSICCSCASQVNVRFGWCEFKCVMKFLSSSLPCVQIMKISSMYLFQVCGFLVHLARNSCSPESMKRFANVGANFVPMAVPHFCLYIFPANSKMLCSSIIRMRLAILSLSPFSSGK